MEQKNPSLPVFLVENTENPSKTRVLHRNMLFPLLTHNLDHTNMLVNTIQKKDSSDEKSESLGWEEDSYEGPMTCSRTKGTTTQTVDIAIKANQEMERHSGIVFQSTKLDFDPNYPDLFAYIEAGFTFIRHWLMNKFQ